MRCVKKKVGTTNNSPHGMRHLKKAMDTTPRKKPKLS